MLSPISTPEGPRYRVEGSADGRTPGSCGPSHRKPCRPPPGPRCVLHREGRWRHRWRCQGERKRWPRRLLDHERRVIVERPGEGGAGGDGGAAAAVPTPEESEAFTDEESCRGAGCSLYERFDDLRLDEEGTCRYGDELHLGVVWPHTGVAVGGTAVTGYDRVEDGVRQDIEAGALDWGGLPGWTVCDAEDPADGACACAGQVRE